MAFPDDPLGVTVELDLGGVWQDVTPDVLATDPVTIIRGEPDEGARVDAGSATFTLNNTSGAYSPRNPRSPYYGRIGHNTPCRISVHAGSPHLDLDGTATGTASTPDTANLRITGDIDLRCEAAIDWLHPTADQVLLSKWGTTGTNRGYMLRVWSGQMHLSWTADGTTILNAFWDLPRLPRRAALRATLDVNNGAGDITVSAYWARSLNGPWHLLGTATGLGATTSIFASTAPLTLGGYDATTNPTRTPAAGTIYRAEVRSGIGGTVVSSVDTTAPTIADTTGRTWKLNGTARHTNRRTRFVGEISAWPARWGTTGQSVTVPVQAAGILRRLGQGASPLQSPMRREFSNPGRTSIVAYWPLEDSQGATSFAAGIGNAPPMTTKGAPQVAAYTDYAASSPLPILDDAALTGRVPAYAPGSQTAARVFVAVPTALPTADVPLLSLACTGTASSWSVARTPTGGLVVKAYDVDGTNLLTSVMAANLAGKQVSVGLNITQSGANVDWSLYYLDLVLSGSTTSGTITRQTVGRVTTMTVGGKGNQDCAVGHVALANRLDGYANTGGAMLAWVGEAAVDRITRLAAEEEVPMWAIDPEDDSTATGAQTTDTTLDLLGTAAAADLGILYEQREQTGLAYRARTTLYNQPPALTLDYAAGEVAPPLEPVDDDQAVMNDITAQREGGTGVRAVAEEGPMSVSDIGRYATEVTLGIAADDQLDDIARWLLHLGTWDEARYPTIRVDLANRPQLVDQAAAVDIGDRITITNPPAWLPPNPIDQIARGYTETLGIREWTIEYNTTPAGPWTVAVADDRVLGRADAEGAQLAAAVSTPAQTSISVAAPDGTLWTTDPADAPFDISVGGEVMTVTAISGATSPQTAVVIRGINGITKTHPASSPVQLAQPARLSL